jgi:undecaprenyl-diphosphatase
MGTLLGALIYFWRDVVKYARAFVRSIAHRSIADVEEKLAWALVVGTIPGAIAGAAFEDTITSKLGQPWLIAVMLAVFGIVLWWVDVSFPSERDLDSIGVGTGLVVGVAQAAALQPGVSRSGITMTAGRLLGIDREAAARFSFLLSLPIIAGAGMVKGLDLVHGGFQGYGAQFFWGFVASGVSGFLVIWGLLGYLRSHTFKAFIWYRLAVATLMIVLIVSGARSATIAG